MSRKEIRNPTIFKLLKNLTLAIMEALDKSFFSDYGSWYDRVKALLQADVDLVAKILQKRPDLEEGKLSRCLLSAQKCLQALLKEDICRKPPHAPTELEYQNELSFFLEKLLKERERIRARALFETPEAFRRHFDRIFLEEYLRYENYLYQDSASDFLICQFQNLACSKEIEIEDHLSIRAITQEEFHSLVQADEKYGYPLESYPEFVLYMPVEDENWRKQLIRLLTALRLLKGEKIGLRRIYYASALPCRPWKIIETPAGTGFAEEVVGNTFDLSETDEKELKHLWELQCRVEKVGYLTVSIRRFNFAYERERLEDRWIDYFVSLESLYSKAEELTEVTYRLATRVSRALTNGSLEDKRELRQKIKRWYRIRSKIVHGMQTNLNYERLQDLEEVLRRSLKWFMSHQDCNNHDRIIDLLDLGG